MFEKVFIEIREGLPRNVREERIVREHDVARKRVVENKLWRKSCGKRKSCGRRAPRLCCSSLSLAIVEQPHNSKRLRGDE
jgi:hypothetical protein